MVEVGGEIDVPTEARLAHHPQRKAQPAGLGPVAPKRPGAVAELEAGLNGDARHVRAVIAPVGHERDAGVASGPREIDREGEVCVRDDNPLDAHLAEGGDAVSNRAVEAASRPPDDLGLGLARPCRDLVVVTHDEDRKGTCRSDHAVGHATSEGQSLVGVERGSETDLCKAEALDRHEHGGAHRGESMVTSMPIRRAVGVLGRPERAEVDERGALYADDGSWRLDWWIGDGEDRWRDPSVDPSVRHHPVDSTPVFETAVRVTAGDVRQRAYCVVEGGVFAVLEVENDSPQPVAVAFAVRGNGPPLLSPRSATTVPLRESPHGPPTDAAVFPLAHQAVLRVAVPLSSAGDGWPSRLAPASRVVAGWRAIDEQGERIEAPGSLPARFALARAQLLLASTSDPATGLLVVAARWRLSNDPADLPPIQEIGRAAQRVAAGARSSASAVDRAALVEARSMLSALAEARAARDIDRILEGLDDAPMEIESDDDIALVAAVRRMLVGDRAGPPTVVLLPDPPAEWAHADVAAHHVPTRWGEVSFAVRWHAERPALLWECEQPVVVTAPALDSGWTSDQPRGEVLLSGVSAT